MACSIILSAAQRLGVAARRALARCERVGDDRLTVVVLVSEGEVRERGDSVTREQQIAFGTARLPPVKNEAKSLLAANHPHAERVRALLQAARAATDGLGLAPFEGDIGLEVVVRGPQDRRWRSDATNVLGGIGDVLQRKQDRPGRVDLSHLGTLAGVALYDDDQQIRQVRYREERASVPSYTTRVWALPPAHQESTGSTQTVVPTAGARGRRVLAMLAARGAELGFDVQREYPVQGGRLDVVWLLPATTAMPGLHGRLPVVGFEVESSWRTRKHLKGDWLNLHDLGAALGVIVLLGAGDDIDATRRFAQEVLATRPGSRVLVWSEADVEDYIGGSAAAAGLAAEAELPGASSAEGVAHTGKYRALWAWLREHPDQRLLVRFAELEELIGLPLPPSCRRHPAHWTSYQGSAVARAIQDAGWVVAKVEVEDEQIMLTRQETQTASASTIAPQS